MWHGSLFAEAVSSYGTYYSICILLSNYGRQDLTGKFRSSYPFQLIKHGTGTKPFRHGCILLYIPYGTGNENHGPGEYRPMSMREGTWKKGGGGEKMRKAKDKLK